MLAGGFALVYYYVKFLIPALVQYLAAVIYADIQIAKLHIKLIAP